MSKKPSGVASAPKKTRAKKAETGKSTAPTAMSTPATVSAAKTHDPWEIKSEGGSMGYSPGSKQKPDAKTLKSATSKPVKQSSDENAEEGLLGYKPSRK